MSMDTARAAFRRPFQFREFLDQTWMVARVSLVPTLLVSIPFTVLVAFTLNILLREIGAADLSGAGTAFGTITQLGPVVTVLVVAGAGATAICADLGARTIREEIDAMRVLGIDPIQRLVVPRVLASTLVALLLNGLVCAIGLSGGYAFLGLSSGRQPGCVYQRSDRAHRTARIDTGGDQGATVRGHGRAGRVLPRSDGQGWAQGGGQCGQRDRRLRVHLPFRDQRSHDRYRCANLGAVTNDGERAMVMKR
ncbi:hypothetical protein MRGA327_21555 [Mycobacterium tuberculosis RGTB327]|nr:hypothetical protein MRGA327_21555 [Mycobacterium tuberculosis RGTB327]